MTNKVAVDAENLVSLSSVCSVAACVCQQGEKKGNTVLWLLAFTGKIDAMHSLVS